MHELFGDNTIGPDGLKAANGFLALAKYDDNNDGRIDSKDAIWSDLVLWNGKVDVNGRSKFKKLSNYEIVGINLDYEVKDITDAYGNEFREHGQIDFANGKQLTMIDVWFRVENLPGTALTSVLPPFSK